MDNEIQNEAAGLHSQEMKLRWSDSEWRARQLELIREGARRPESRQRRSDAAKERWHNPASRAVHIASLNTPEHRARSSAHMTAKWADATWRQKRVRDQAKIIKARWADPAWREMMRERQREAKVGQFIRKLAERFGPTV